MKNKNKADIYRDGDNVIWETPYGKRVAKIGGTYSHLHPSHADSPPVKILDYLERHEVLYVECGGERRTRSARSVLKNYIPHQPKPGAYQPAPPGRRKPKARGGPGPAEDPRLDEVLRCLHLIMREYVVGPTTNPQ